MKIKGFVSAAFTIILGLSLNGCSSPIGSSTAPVAGIAVSATTLSTSEDGTEASFNVTLTTQPAALVFVDFESLDTSEGLLITNVGWYYSSVASLSFSPDNWDIPQTITVRGQDDSVIDGAQTYTVAATLVDSTDPSYSNVALPSVSVTNSDNDVKGVTLSKTSLSTTENSWSSDWFSVRLDMAPSGNVEIPLNITDASEGSFNSASSVTTKTLTFTPTDWSSSQYVYVYDVDDLIADGNQTYNITVGPTVSTADAGYNGLTVSNVSVSNLDDDTAGVTVSKSAVTTNEWGSTASFDVVLNTEPTADVVIPVTSLDTTEGLISSNTSVPAGTLDLTFTPLNWNVPQTVTVTGQDDITQDLDISYNITVGAPTGATEYTSLALQNVAVVNVDDDTARVNIQGANLQTSEDIGGSATFAVSLGKAPTGTVVVSVTSVDFTEGRVMGGSSPSVAVDAINLTFDTTNWKTAQTVTVVGQDDPDVDGNQAYNVNVAIDKVQTIDADYDLVSAQSVSVTNADNDVAGLTITGYVSVSESGITDVFTVKLNTRPMADVIIPLTVSDATEIQISSGASGQVNTLNLTFTPTNWSTAQTVTVYAIDDFLDESYEYHDVSVGATSSTDLNYNGLAAVNKQVTVSDNDTAGFVITPNSGLTTSEDGTSFNFTVALSSEPLANVFVTITSGNLSEGKLTGGNSPTTQVDSVMVEFTPATWQSGQLVTIHGQDDTVLDGPTIYDLTVATVTGTDTKYNTVSSLIVPVVNTDNEVGISETMGLTRAQLPHTGQVAPGSTSTYTLSGLPAGWKYKLTAGNITDDIALSIKDSTGTTLLCSSAKIGVKTDEFCTLTTPADGIVTIIIDGAGTLNGAMFTLSLSSPSFAYTFETFGNTTANDIYLYDSSAVTTTYPTSLTYAWGFNGNPVVTYDLVEGQTYYLKVRPYSTTSTPGAYKVQVTDGAASLVDVGTAISDIAGEPGDNTATGASTLTVNLPLERYLSSGDTDWFKFTVPLAP